MFHKCKSGLNEYWSRKGMFTVLETLVTMDFYHLEALPSSFFFLSEVTILWSICLLVFRMWLVH